MLQAPHNTSRSRSAAVAGAGATPMMAQYLKIKQANPDCLLFYRMGDFYELFFDDAVQASAALGIALTKRGKHRGEDIPMCGVPVHSADDYLQRLIRQGFRVAVCEQLEDPAEAKKRGHKAVVRRDVVRLVTAGTLTEEALLEARRNNYLVCVARVRGAAREDSSFAVAWLDISTGVFQVLSCHGESLAAELARLDPGEIVLSERLHDDSELKGLWQQAGPVVTPLPASYFDSASAETRLRDYFSVAALDAFGAFSRSELAACGGLVGYVDLTQVGQKPAISPPRRQAPGGVMQIDPATRSNLELLRSSRGEHSASLLAAIDRSVTAAGARELADRLASPLTEPARINARFDAVAFFADDGRLRTQAREALRTAPDIARALSRLALGRGGPRDLGALGGGMAAAGAIAGLLEESRGINGRPAEISRALAALRAPDPVLAEQLAAVLAEELPVLLREGGFVRTGYSQELDEARTLRDESRRVIAGLQANYAELAGVRSLKVRHNNVLGYFVDVTAQHGQKLMAAPLNETFIHRQTLANAVRFTTLELGELEQKIAAAADRALGIGLDIFEELRRRALACADALKAAAEGLARLDVHAGLAELAVEENYVRPKVDDSLAFAVHGGRHPVVEQALRGTAASFVANDCDLGPVAEAEKAASIWLVTGPNMAGKSTYLRQNALIAVLAQMGSFVPASKANIGVVDRLFSRVGASDDLARGRSTFMVEMVETATILNQAGPRSLVILDEIGRGTATFDGLSIAWAAVEHLHEVNGCRTLFATHFHELTSLQQRLGRLKNVTMTVKEWSGDLVFLHEVTAGAADRSYGIQVARLAGLPASVLARAREVLGMLEEGEAGRAGARLIDDLPLFSVAQSAPAPSPADPQLEALKQRLEAADPDEMTPREALDLIYELKRRLTGTA